MSNPEAPKTDPDNGPDAKPDKADGNDTTVTLRIEAADLSNLVNDMVERTVAMQKAVNERIMTAVLVNVEAILKEHADRLYLMGQVEVDDATKLDPTVFTLFRGLDGGITYAQLRSFNNFFAKGMASRRVSGVPGTQDH